jgi:hypothetical protein
LPGIASHFLFVAGGEGLDLQVRQQLLHLAVGQLAALNAGGGADALDGSHAAQRRQAVRCECAQGAPGAFELVDPGNEAQNLRGDLEGVGFQYEPPLNPFTPNLTRLWLIELCGRLLVPHLECLSLGNQIVQRLMSFSGKRRGTAVCHAPLTLGLPWIWINLSG